MLNKKAIFINTASQVIVRFVTLAFTLVSIKLLTNYLGPSGVGNYNTITTYINFFIVIADLGLFSVTVREISKNPEKEKKIISNVFSIRLLSAIVAVLVAISLVFLTKYERDIKLGVLIASGFVLFNLLSSVYDMILQHRLKMQYSALAEFLSKLITLVALYFIIKFNGSFLLIISTVLVSGILIFIFKFIFAKKFLDFSPVYDKKIANWILNISWPLGLVFIVNNLFFKLDTLLLYIIKGPVEVGIYSVAYKVLEVSVFIGAYFTSALKPAISENIEKNKNVVANIISKSFNLLLFAATPITLICIIFAKDIIIFLSNTEFLSGSNALVLLAFTLPFIYFDMLLGEILVANDERKLLIKISIFILVFNLLTNLFFIPKYSFMGAALTTLLSEILLMIVNLYYTKKIVNYKIDFTAIAKIIIISLLTMVAAFLIKLSSINFIILITLTIMIFFAFSLMLRIFSISSIKQLIKPENANS